jgi:hypothetical protein
LRCNEREGRLRIVNECNFGERRQHDLQERANVAIVVGDENALPDRHPRLLHFYGFGSSDEPA